MAGKKVEKVEIDIDRLILLTSGLAALSASVSALTAVVQENTKAHKEHCDDNVQLFGKVFERLDKLNNQESQRQGAANLLRTWIPWALAIAAIICTYLVGTH